MSPSRPLVRIEPPPRPGGGFFRNALALSLRRLHASGVPPPGRRRENFHGLRLCCCFSPRRYAPKIAIRCLLHVSTLGRSSRSPALRRLDTWCLAPLAPALLFLHAANGETGRTVVAALGVHVGTVEEQVRPAHARRRVRCTAPGVTVRAHTVQAAGIAGAVTRSGDDVSAPPLSYSCTQRTGKPNARWPLLSGCTADTWKYKFIPTTADAELGELLQTKPLVPTSPRPPEPL